MGEIKFRYLVHETNIDPKNIAGEIEYGITFLLYPDKEIPIFPKYKNLRWLKTCEMETKNSLVIIIDDGFFTQDTIFDKILTVFLLNFQDFAKFKLISIDFSNSFVISQFKSVSDALHLYNDITPTLGTILKPYYQTIKEKMEAISIFTDCGLKIVKEDETFLTDKETILNHAINLQGCIQGKGYYVPNITSFINDYAFIDELIEKSHISIAMVNFFICGLGNIFKLKKKFPNLLIWGHRVGNIAFENMVSPQSISVLAISTGIDFLHIGTPLTREMYTEKMDDIELLNQIKPMQAVFTKTTTTTINSLVKFFGNRAVYMTCGSYRNEDGVSINIQKLKEWERSANQ